jgi:hypothetical protein
METKPPSSGPGAISTSAKTKKTADGRYIFEHDGHEVYQWEQSMEEVLYCSERLVCVLFVFYVSSTRHSLTSLPHTCSATSTFAPRVV